MTAAEAKEELKSYRRINRRIDRLLERKARLFEKLTSAPGQTAGTPPPSGDVHDRIGEGTVALVHYEERINSLIDELVKAQDRIENVLSRMDGTQAELLELMYLDGKKLNEVAEELHYSYRQACRIHGRALLAAADFFRKMSYDVLECPMPPVL